MTLQQIVSELDRLSHLEHTEEIKDGVRALADSVRYEAPTTRVTLMRDGRPVVASWVTWPTD